MSSRTKPILPFKRAWHPAPNPYNALSGHGIPCLSSHLLSAKTPSKKPGRPGFCRNLSLYRFRTDMESDAAWTFYAEHASDAFHDIQCEMCMFPIFVLPVMHIERHTFDFSQFDIGITDDHCAFREAHRARAVAASAGLVEYEWTVLFFQLPDEGSGCLCCIYTVQRFHFRRILLEIRCN